MSDPTIEQRVAVLEDEVARLRARVLSSDASTPIPWWKLWEGAFLDDPMFEEAMRLGAEYRRSLVPPSDNDASA